MAISKSHLKFYALLVLLFAVSFFKDQFTPDYLNTENAAFLKSNLPRWHTIFENPTFWLKAIAFSGIFVLIPYTICNVTPQFHSKQYVVLIILISIIMAEYVLVLINLPLIDKAIVPKINRIYHSPVITLFLLAAFTLDNRVIK